MLALVLKICCDFVGVCHFGFDYIDQQGFGAIGNHLYGVYKVFSVIYRDAEFFIFRQLRVCYFA
jgi:hypothetical protein